MRITGGRYKGRTVQVPATGVRPTPARVREALFSILGQDLSGWSVIDACAGTGIMGLEAASRGAGPILFVERNPKVAHRLRGLAKDLGASASVLVSDARRLRTPPADLVFADPPYADDPLEWRDALAPLALRCLVVEHRSGPTLDAPEGFETRGPRVYGDTALTLFWRGSDAAGPPGDEVGDDPGVVEGEG